MALNMKKSQRKSADRIRQIKLQKQYFESWLKDELKELKMNQKTKDMMRKMALIGYDRGVQERV